MSDTPQCRVSYDGRVVPLDAARVLRVPPFTLRNWRDRRYGPRPGRPLWGCWYSYDLTELYQFLIESAM
jgi:hypothetical protein